MGAGVFPMKRLGFVLLCSLVVSLALAWACTLDRPPVTPIPSAGGSSGGASFVPLESGGSAGTTSAAGGSAAGGVAGSASTSPDTVAIEWPECDQVARQAKPSDVQRLRLLLMPERPQQIKRKIRASYQLLELPSVNWPPLGPTLEQIGSSCVGNAIVQMRVSRPWTWSGTLNAEALEYIAMGVYDDATTIDEFAGQHPPDDTGTSGEAGVIASVKRGLFSRWLRVVSFEGLQHALQLGPCVTGTAWYTSMFSPNRCGQLDVSGVVEGYHEWKVNGIDFKTKRILGLNSWGPWGARLRSSGERGYFWLTFGNFQRLLNEGADIHCAYVD